MIAFSNDQFETLQTVWQADQLLGQIPEILVHLKEQYSSLYDELGEEKNRENAHLRIEDAVNYGYTDIEDIKQQLDMQYQNRAIIFTDKSYQTLYQTQTITPQDRNSVIAELLLIQRYSAIIHPYMRADALYQSGTNNILENYIADEKQADYPKNSPYHSNIHLVRHGRIYRLLKHYLPNENGWESANSDWKTSTITIKSESYHRKIQLLPNKESGLEYSFEEEDLPQLKLLIPDSLKPEEQAELGKLLSAWTLQLYPIKKMKQEFERGLENA